MNIRNATAKDLPGVVELLKVSLGEGLIKKSMELWKWKHLDNPHGASPVLIAEEGGGIAGVRAFLQWQWVYKGVKYPAVRAVDTATHPKFQGRGIFKKLTLRGLADAQQNKTQFVFNTPNNNSKPGYLKMGWVEQGPMPLKLKINLLSYKTRNSVETPKQDWEKLQCILPALSNPASAAGLLHTALSPAYINWRYRDNPLYKYYFVSDYHSYVIFYRIKQHSFGKELRITDAFSVSGSIGKVSLDDMHDSFKKTSKDCFLISASGRHYELLKNIYPSMGILPVLKKGPLVTLRNLNLTKEEFEAIVDSSCWAYSLGDMELF